METMKATDRLVDESEKLRRQLSRTSAKMDLFCEELMAETRDLRERTGETQTVERDTDADRGASPGDAGPS